MRLFSALMTAALSVGCTTADDTTTTPTGGGKADDGISTGRVLVELPDSEQAYLRAADVECLHINATDVPDYDVRTKMFCLEAGGVGGPIQTFIALVSLGEIGTVHKVYAVPEWFGGVPTNVTFDRVGYTTNLHYDIQLPDGDAPDDVLVYQTHRLSAEIRLGGDREEPTATVTYRVE